MRNVNMPRRSKSDRFNVEGGGKLEPFCRCKQTSLGGGRWSKQEGCRPQGSSEEFRAELTAQYVLEGETLNYNFACEVHADNACKHTFTIRNKEQSDQEQQPVRRLSPFACGEAKKVEMGLYHGATEVCWWSWWVLVALQPPLVFLYCVQVHMVLNFLRRRCNDVDDAVDEVPDWGTQRSGFMSDWDDIDSD